MKNFYLGKKILITGHTGFKGAWLTQILLNWGADIVGVSLPPNTSPNLFSTLSLENKVRNYFADIIDYRVVKGILDSEKPDIVFHLAAQPIVRLSYDNPLETYRSNVVGTANILQAVKEVGGVKAAVIITTDKVYENKEWIYPYREFDALGGYDPYSASKAAADIVTNSYIQSFFNVNKYQIDHHTLVGIARAGNVIGGGDWAPDRLIPDIIRSIFERNVPVVIRSPKAIRPWQHVLESLNGYLQLAQGLFEGRQELVGAWNFGPEEESFVNVETMLKYGIEACGQGSFEIEEDTVKHEAKLLKLDICKAKEVLGWRPKIGLLDNVKMTFEWYKYFYVKEDIIQFTQKQIDDYFEL